MRRATKTMTKPVRMYGVWLPTLGWARYRPDENSNVAIAWASTDRGAAQSLARWLGNKGRVMLIDGALGTHDAEARLLAIEKERDDLRARSGLIRFIERIRHGISNGRR